MKIPIPIPRFVLRAWDKFGDIANVTVYERGRFEVRRLDIALALFGVGGFFYYLAFDGWQTAVLSTLTYVMVLMFCWII